MITRIDLRTVFVFIAVATGALAHSDAFPPVPKQRLDGRHAPRNSKAIVGDDEPIVNITGGLMQGSLDQYSYFFKGIPFAAPPIGALRFKDPQPVVPWPAGSVLRATRVSAGCMQRCVLPRPDFTCPREVSEDCLYLNVFTPTLPANGTNSDGADGDTPLPLLPVMAWIHGGAFLAGAAGTRVYEASQLAQRERMVIVTFNYRLGAFGALYNGEGITGNFMLKDQRAALRWIQDNIRQFGGDPRRVTIGGQSAGAMSVGCHLASPNTNGLYSAAMSSNPLGIQMSTPPLMKWLHDKLADAVKCGGGGQKEGDKGSSRSDTVTMTRFECLQRVDADVLLNASLGLRPVPTPQYAFAALLPWLPVVTADDELAVQPLFAPTRLGERFPNVSIMMGTVANDGLVFVYQTTAKPYPYWVARLLLTYLFNTSVVKAIEAFYGTYADSAGTMHAWLGAVVNDYLFYCPNRHYSKLTAQRLSQHVAPNLLTAAPPPSSPSKPSPNSIADSSSASVYGWFLSQVPSFRAWIWGEDESRQGCAVEENACHSNDLPYLFRTNLYRTDADGGCPSPTTDSRGCSVTLSVRSSRRRGGVLARERWGIHR